MPVHSQTSPNICRSPDPAGGGSGRTGPGASSEMALIGIEALRRALPFGLGRQPRAGPVGVGVGLVVADMA